MCPPLRIVSAQGAVTGCNNLTSNIAYAEYWAWRAARNSLLFFAGMALMPGLAVAAQATATLAAGESLTEAYLRFLAGLALVIGAMLILYAILKKRFSLLHNRGGSRIRVIETRPVAPHKSLCLAEVDGEEFLLGLSEDGISLLAAFGQRHNSPDGQTKSQSFDSILKTSQAASQAAGQP